MKKYIYIPIIFFVGIYGCETLRDIEIERVPDKLVVLGEFHSDSVVQITLSRSVFITDNLYNQDNSARGSEVLLYEEGRFVEKLEQLPLLYEIEYFSTYRSPSGFIPTKGTTYTIEVNASGYNDVLASTKVPFKSKIVDVDILENEVPITKDYSGYAASISFESDSDELNYYELTAHRRSQERRTADFGDENVEMTETEYVDPLGITPRNFQSSGLGSDNPFKWRLFLTSDELIGDSIKEFECYVGDYYGNEVYLGKYIYPEYYEVTESIHSIFMKLKHITKAQYDYGRTSDLQIEKGDDPFVEPVFVKSNIENGLGIFAGFSETLSQDITSDNVFYYEE